MLKRMPSISIVVLVWNQYEVTVDCIQSLLRLNYPNYRILIVDNHSEELISEKLVKEFGSQIDTLINEANLGYTGGNNVGIYRSIENNADYVLLLNNDTIVSEDCLLPLVKTLQSNPRAGAVTPKIYYLHEPTRIWAAGGKIHWWFGLASNRGQNQTDRGQYDQTGPVDYASGCCILITRQSLEKVGLFDERFFAYFEDADWCVRAQQAGYQILYEPASKIWHVAGASTRKTGKRNMHEGRTTPFVYYLITRNNLWFIKRYSKGLVRITAQAVFTVRHLFFYSFVFIALRRWNKLEMLWRGAGDGWRD